MSGAPSSSAALIGRFVYVYDGGTCLGHIVNRGPAGYEAFDIDDRSLGIFSTQREAAAALMVLA
jgi:hypothetical protein